MWKANIISIEQDPDAILARVKIQYLNDDTREKTVIERISEPETLKQIVANGIAELNRIDRVADFIANPPLGEIDLTPPAPTDEQLNLQAYGQKKQELIQAKTDLDLGVIEKVAYEVLLADVKDAKSLINLDQPSASSSDSSSVSPSI